MRQKVIDATGRLSRQSLQHIHLREKARRRYAFVDDVGCYGGLDEPLAASADPFAADMPLDLEHARYVVELLADVLADALEAAASALGLLGLVTDFPAG